MTDLALRHLPALPEAVLPASLLDRLPSVTPSAPWRCEVRAVVWVQRGTAPLPPASPYAHRTLPVVLGAFVEYLDSPVGPYCEVFAGQLLRGVGVPSVHIPFMAVDSLPSLHGGRRNWSLPKVMASFDGDIGEGRATATGADWSVDVDASTIGPAIPLAGPLSNLQAGRRAAVTLRGRGRPGLVRVKASGPSLTRWLGTGTRPGFVATGRMVIHAPRPREES